MNQFTSRLVVVAAMTALLFGGSTASAQTRQAFVQMDNVRAFIFSGAFVSAQQDFGVVEVGTGATPSIMIPAKLLSNGVTGVAYGANVGGPASIPFATKTTHIENAAATLRANNPSAAPSGMAAGVVVVPTAYGYPGSFNVTVPATGGVLWEEPAVNTGAGETKLTTTNCFKEVTSSAGMALGGNPMRPSWVALNPGTIPGECFPRFGNHRRIAGAKKYGGSLAFIGDSHRQGRFVAATGFSDFNLYQRETVAATAPAPNLAGRQPIVATATWTNTVTLVPALTQAHGASGIPTTGAVTAVQPGPPYTTFIQRSGSFAMTRQGSTAANTDAAVGDEWGARISGTISVVKPGLVNHFRRTGAILTGVKQTFGNTETVTLTFINVPEPGSVVMLGMGALTLLGFARVRRQ